MDITDKTIGNLVAEDYRYAAVFQKHGIDFCCGGGASLRAACEKRGLDPMLLERDLIRAVQDHGKSDDDPNAWPLDRLIGHILEKHHAYLRRTLPVLTAYARKVARVHGESDPEVIEIASLIEALSAELEQHMMKEERILFPVIVNAAAARRGGMLPESIGRPIQVMEAEHEAAGDILHTLRTLSHDYTPPAHACNTYRVQYLTMKELEADLFRHIHLENNILFPKALAMAGGAT